MFFFFQAEDGIRDLVRSRGLGDVYKRQGIGSGIIGSFESIGKDIATEAAKVPVDVAGSALESLGVGGQKKGCLLYTSDAADERSSVDLGGRRIIKKKKNDRSRGRQIR